MIAVVFVKNSERFPGKHGESIDGVPLIDRVVERIKRSEKIKNVLVFSKTPEINSRLCRNDRDASEGSIADSLLLALRTYGDIFAFAGDMPCISSEVIDEMIAMSKGVCVVPAHSNGMLEPLHAIYRSDSSNVLERNISSGKNSLNEFIRSIPHIDFKITEANRKNFVNLNFPEDLESIRVNGCR